MLGSMIVDVLSRAGDLRVRATYRGDREAIDSHFRPRSVEWISFDAERDNIGQILVGEPWIINAIGIIKPLIHEDRAEEVRRAVLVNSLFPFAVAAAAARGDARVIQIATDCVFSGREGSYHEDSPHDPLDVYGKTKSLGEVAASHFLNLRCSIVGPELRGHLSLLDWFLSQPRHASVRGFVNHRWNGITTLHFAQIVLGLVQSNSRISGTHHIVPHDSVTKAQLLREFATAFERKDIQVQDAAAPEPVDRTLSTKSPLMNDDIWHASGRDEIPNIRTMLNELARLRDADPSDQDAVSR